MGLTIVRSPPVAPRGAAIAPGSFADLARSTTAPLFTALTSNLGRISDSAMPHDATLKALRKDMQRLRDHLDVFAFAYGKGADEKVWDGLRKKLDQGYEQLGHFKDLFDSQGLTLNADGTP